MTYICGKWFKYLKKGYNMWEMTQKYWKWLKYVGNGVSI